MGYPVYIFFGLLPSVIWLLFYLRKDSHPESNRMVIKIFLWGVLITIPAALVEIGIFSFLVNPFSQWIETSSFLFLLIYNIFAISLVEEISKYLVVREKIVKDPAFDEPVDAMIYMIIAALGFAALENLLILAPFGKSFLFGETLKIVLLRFIGATFLHALASGIIGFFLALSFYYSYKRIRLYLTGFGLAVSLHAVYNLSIIKIVENDKYIIVPVIALALSAVFVSFGFKKLKKIKSICKTKKSWTNLS